jgi:hypothetical protein
MTTIGLLAVAVTPPLSAGAFRAGTVDTVAPKASVELLEFPAPAEPETTGE